MISAVGVSRQFEALSRVVQAYDDMLGRSIEKLAEV
jgi:flagellar basal body rod protein FlgG